MMEWPVPLTHCKYSRFYEALVNRAACRILPKAVYVERHHIVPKCFGGSNKKENMVRLTGREHYIAHALLWKMKFSKLHHEKMTFAFNLMASKTAGPHQHRTYSCHSRIYATLREEMSKTISANRKEGFASGRLKPHNKGVFGIVKRSNETIQKRLSTMRAAGKLSDISGPIEVRGIHYDSLANAARAMGKTKWKVKSEINIIGHNPTADDIIKFEAGEFRNYHKGGQTLEQRQRSSATKRAKHAALREAGLPLPQCRKQTEETKIKIGLRAKERHAAKLATKSITK